MGKNRIVIDYGDREELVLLAVINNETNDELDVKSEAKRINCECVKYYKIKTISDLTGQLKTLDGNNEGFVVRYSNGLRVKLKGEEYLRLHRLITGFSTRHIWECLMNGTNFDDLLKDIPDEFMEWVEKKRAELEKDFRVLWMKAHKCLVKVVYLKTREDVKAQA